MSKKIDLLRGKIFTKNDLSILINAKMIKKKSNYFQ